MTTVTFEISKYVAQCAEARGLLNSETMKELLQDKEVVCSTKKLQDPTERKQLTKVSFDLPEEMAVRASSLGLLNSEKVEDLIRVKVRSCAAESFCRAAEDLHKTEPPITEDELMDICRKVRRGEHDWCD